MSLKTYRAGVIGLGMIGGADQVSGDVLGQCVNHMDGTHVFAYQTIGVLIWLLVQVVI